MNMRIMDEIRARQALSQLPLDYAPPPHMPEMLYIGCIDARLDPIDDIGIPKGKALIFRNIGALVAKEERAGGGVIAHNTSIGAALEFFLTHLPIAQGRGKHIVVSGHTDCGGLKACRHGGYDKGDHHLPLYLQTLKEVRARVMDAAQANGWDDARILHALEMESVRQSVANLMTYPVVARAVEEGRLEVHGWVIDTATQRICEMNPLTREFEPMAKPETHP